MIRILVILSTIIAMMAPSRADACSCVVGAPVCETFWKTDAVFSGTVIEISPIPNPNGERFLASKRVRFQVLQSWRGSVGSVIEVTTGAGGGDCGYGFEQGAAYLVYAHSRGGVLSTGICSRTRPLGEASEDLAYLKTALRPSATGRIFGSVTYRRDRSNYSGPERFISGYPVELTDGRGSWKTTSNHNGRFEFSDILAGTYKITLSTPDTEHAYGPSNVTLADPRGCAAADFYVVPDGRLSVRIVDQERTPVGGVSIELLDVEQGSSEGPVFPLKTQKSGADGRVEFSQLPPRFYVLAINGTYPPSPRQPFATGYFPDAASRADARTIDLGRGERLDLGDWIVPEVLAERRVAGQVVWPDGKPAAGAHLLLSAASSGPWAYRSVDAGSVTTDADGRFTLIVHQRVAYEVRAYINVGEPIVQWNTRRVHIPATASAAPIRLDLQPPAKR